MDEYWYTTIDLHPSRAQLQELHEENRQLIVENRLCRTTISTLASELYISRERESDLRQEVEHLRKNWAAEITRASENAQQVAFQKQTTEALQLQLVQLKAEKTEPYYGVVQSPLKKQDLELENSALRYLINKMKQEETKLLQENHDLRDRQLRSSLPNIAGITESNNLLPVIKCGRFVIKKRCLECRNCRQSFDSLTDMESTKCHFHPARPTVTANRCYYWTCCESEAVGKSCPGCKEGEHIAKPD